jgi:type IX secretion system PorP/SprF family membrane protein
LSWGVLLLSDKTFFETQTKAFATFSYRLPVVKKSSLFLEIQGGGTFTNVDFTNTRILNNDDPSLGNASHFYPNIGAGAYWQGEKFYVSFSLPMLFGHRSDKESNELAPTPADDLHSYFSAGLRLPVFAKDWEFLASTLIRWVPNAPNALVFNAGLAYRKTELNLGYHKDGTLGASLLVSPLSGLAIGYSYQFPTPDLFSQINTSNHELMVRIRLDSTRKQSAEQLVKK